MSRFQCALLSLLLLQAAMLPLPAQQSELVRKNSLGVFGEYSNDSSHILLGAAEQRKLLAFGVAYSRSLLAGPAVNLQYHAELRPLIFESDPVLQDDVTIAVLVNGSPPQSTHFQNPYTPVHACHSGVQVNSVTFRNQAGQQETVQDTNNGTCTRQWTFAQGMSPVGMRLNFLTHRRLQPVFTGLGGFMLSSRSIPTSYAGSFNFTFELGAGVELFRSRDRSIGLFGNRSLTAEYRYHHISNAGTAKANPGIDNGLVQLTYAFGR